MQRQSLGSPAGKYLPPNHPAAEDDDDDGKKKRKKKAGGGAGVLEIADGGGDGSETMPERPPRRSSSGGGVAGTERSIHLIPVLILLCFLVLYFCSHDPSTTDMADIGGVGRPFDKTAVSAAGIGRYAAAGGGAGVSAALRGHRSLKELERLRGHHGSRKLGRRSAA